MKITFLGTGAIGYPLAFCNCDNCQNARKYGEKSLRKRASILINDDLLIDLGPDTQSAMMIYNKNMGKVKYLLQTHIHTDHYDQGLLCARIPYMAMQNHPKLEIFAHPSCLEIMSNRINQYEHADLISNEGQKRLNVESKSINAGDKFKVGKYIVKAIVSAHDVKHGSLLYVVQSEDKTLFYATDTPALTDLALSELKEYKLDCVIMDHTFGDVDYSYSHLNTKLFIEQLAEMKKLNIINNTTKIYGTHISHDGMPYYELAEKDAISNGYHIAYDGLELDL
mgnify:CR=1 FL=1